MKLKIEVVDRHDKDSSLSHWVSAFLVPEEGEREEAITNVAIQISQIARFFDLAKAIEKAVEDFYNSISLTPITDKKDRTSDFNV